MPIDNIAFYNIENAYRVQLSDFNPQIILRVQVPIQYLSDINDPKQPESRSGSFLVLGRVVIENRDGDPQNATAMLTTPDARYPDGYKDIDQVTMKMEGKDEENGFEICISLQTVVNFSAENRFENQGIIDLRCLTHSGLAKYPSLIVTKIDGIQYAGIP